MTEEVQTVEATVPQGEIAEVPAEQTPEPAPEKQQEEKPKVDPVQRRIDKLTREKYELKARLQLLEEQRQEREAAKQQPTQKDDDEPREDQYQDWTAYQRALARYEARKEAREALESERKQRQAESQKTTQQKAAESWQKRIAETRKELPDYDDVVEAADVPITPALAQAVIDSDMGPKVAYYLARNPEEAEKLADLSPVAIARAIGRIEAKLETEALAKKTSSAPKPVQPVGSRAVAEKDPDKMNADDWLKWRNKQLAERNKR